MSIIKRYFGLHGSSRAWLIAQLHREYPQISVISKSRKEAENLSKDLKFFASESSVYHFPAWDTLPFEPVSPQAHISANRNLILNLISTEKPFIVATSIETLTQKVLPSETISERKFVLQTGHSLDRLSLLSQLEQSGFQRVSLVEEVGDLAVRGGVIDIFPAGSNNPVRLEFLGDTIEKIKTFEVGSQRSTEDLATVEILPVKELISFKSNSCFHNLLGTASSRIKERSQELETPPRETARILSAIKENRHLPGMEAIMPIALENYRSFFDYLSRSSLLIMDDEISCFQNLDSYWDLIREREERFSKEHYLIPKSSDLYLSSDQLKSEIDLFQLCHIGQLEIFDSSSAEPFSSKNISSISNIELKTRLQTKVGTGRALEPLLEIINKWRSFEFRIAFVVGSKTRAGRLHRHLLNLNLDAKLLSLPEPDWYKIPTAYPLVIMLGHIAEGFQLPNEKIAFISENELFSHRSYRSKKVQSERTIKKLLGSLSTLQEENFVVHEDYGIGIYKGLIHLLVEDTESDFLQINYADSKLYLPIQNIGKIQRYFAAEGQTPIVDKLGSKRWIRTKQKVKESVTTLAGDLIRLYAARSVAKGWRYDSPGAEDDRFADDFSYDETPDQLAAIQDTLKDMASDKPMDRLICGDVGFGKTEVAIRAAYKAIQHARQVAVLVPTTILVEQHKATFRQRFEEYPVKIGVVSRFYKPPQNRKTLDELEEGKTDIIIGTHKLLQKNIQFRDLGLLIVDEEHRFGVKQKEKLKQFKKEIDVLTLTATPIPRTLHMSLINVRDASVISTPPHDRRLIRTYVATRSDTIIRDALLREHQRGGQSFFLHNRVQSIEHITASLKELVPEIKFEFAHGQMRERILEDVMRRFIEGEIDVLVCTSIIESGVDIPNVNTIIIDRAHQFGLAQLYQLRGRVGRSTRQAYAYLLIPKTRRLGSDAQKRLKVLQSLDDLGQGFNLALRDLEIRGAGNLLGKAQSGNVYNIGYELYTKILKEAVLHLKGEELDLEEYIDPEVKINISAFIPESYIPDISERLVLYQRLAAVISNQDTDELAREIEDRFGPYGEEVDNFIEIMRLRGLLRKHGIVKADCTKAALTLSFNSKAKINLQKIMDLEKSDPKKYKFGKSLSLNILLNPEQPLTPIKIYRLTSEILNIISYA